MVEFFFGDVFFLCTLRKLHTGEVIFTDEFLCFGVVLLCFFGL